MEAFWTTPASPPRALPTADDQYLVVWGSEIMAVCPNEAKAEMVLEALRMLEASQRPVDA